MGQFQWISIYNHNLPFQISKERIMNASRPAPPSLQNSGPNSTEQLIECCRICDLVLNEKSTSSRKWCEFCGLAACQDCVHTLRRLPKQMVIENAKDETPRSRCCKVCLRKFFMQASYDRLFGKFGQVKTAMGDETHADVEERLKMKHSDLKLRFEAVQNKQQALAKIRLQIQYIDRQQMEREEEFKMIIIYQQEKFSEEREKVITHDNRILEKQNDLERLKTERNNLIDQNFKDKNTSIELRKEVQQTRAELICLKNLIKQAKIQINNADLENHYHETTTSNLSFRRLPTQFNQGSAIASNGPPNMVIFTHSNSSESQE